MSFVSDYIKEFTTDYVTNFIAGGFNPLSLSPALWLDASDTSTITESGGAVSQWDDKSGNDYHATQSTGANQPTTGTRTQNGLNALDFDGAGDNLEIDYSGLFSTPDSTNSIFIVWKTDDTAADQRVFTGFVSGSSRWGMFYRLGGGADLAAQNNTSFSPTRHTITPDTNIHVDFLRREGSSLTSGRDGSITTAANGADLSTVNDIRLGATTGATASVNGLICEVIVLSSNPDDATVNNLFNYFNNKWGTSAVNL